MTCPYAIMNNNRDTYGYGIQTVYRILDNREAPRCT